MSLTPTANQPCEESVDDIEAQLSSNPLAAVSRPPARRSRRAAKDSSLHWCKHKPAEFTSQTRHLSVAALGAYCRLRDHQFVNGRIPDDDAMIARIIGESVEYWQALRPAIADLFDADDGYLYCPDMEAKSREAREQYERHSANGYRGGVKSAALRAVA